MKQLLFVLILIFSIPAHAGTGFGLEVGHRITDAWVVGDYNSFVAAIEDNNIKPDDRSSVGRFHWSVMHFLTYFDVENMKYTQSHKEIFNYLIRSGFDPNAFAIDTENPNRAGAGKPPAAFLGPVQDDSLIRWMVDAGVKLEQVYRGRGNMNTLFRDVVMNEAEFIEGPGVLTRFFLESGYDPSDGGTCNAFSALNRSRRFIGAQVYRKFHDIFFEYGFAYSDCNLVSIPPLGLFD